ncbi:protein kinase [Streptomyces sp. CA-250714]|uniref:protein kinase n=1 Tax=Streptomyces sp. CA-250714 TaxID=3240060 RepID=UPI003D8C2F94
MEENAGYAGRLLADRYRLPLPPADAYELAESPAWDTASGQEVLVRQVPLPEVVEAEVVDDGYSTPGRSPDGGPRGQVGRATRRPADPGVRRAMEAAVAAAQLPDHPRLDQVFDVFVEDDGLWIVSESVPARPLASLLAERPLGAHRAAEIAADLLAALRIVHAHGWVHRNVTARTVLICEDGRALLTGLAVGAAEEALCGYDPLPPPPPDGPETGPGAGPGTGPETGPGAGPVAGAESGSGSRAERGTGSRPGPVPRARRGAEDVSRRRAGDAGGAAGPEASHRPGRGGPAPATWTGHRLPAGFTARDSGSYEARRDEGTDDLAAHPYGAEERRRGIFGFEGIEPEEDVRGPRGQGLPGREDPPDDISARAARRGAIAAYREGAQRAAADTRDAGRRAQEGDEGARRPPGTDWWSTAPGGGPAGQDAEGEHGAGPTHALDDDVRWLPSDEDEVLPGALTDGGVREVERDEIYGPHASGPYGVPPPYGRTGADDGPGGGGRRPGTDSGPTALPGARPADTRSIPAPWATGRDEPHREQPATEYAAEYGTEYGAEYGTEPATEYAAEYGTEYGTGTEASPVPDASPDPGDGGPWGGAAESVGRYRGPATALAAERARHARMTVVGPVTERWAPEQAGPVYENWRLAPPVGPAADLWALGVLLFRAVQGHAPYPEDSAAELVQMVCAEPPAFAEDCGPLRPVVESLMRQDPTERPDFEELRGWLRSIIRSAPEPDVGLRTVTAPLTLDAGGPADPRRLPIVRRRGELVRRRRRAKRAAAAERPPRRERVPRADRPQAEPLAEPVQRHRGPKRGGGPRRLGLLVLALILLGMAAAVAFVAWFMPGDDGGEGAQKGSVVVPEEQQPERTGDGGSGDDKPADKPDGKNDDKNDSKDNDRKDNGSSGSESGNESGTDDKAPKGYRISNDPAGFRIAVPKEWDRRSSNGRGQVRYNGGEVEMVVVNGRDGTGKFGKDPMAYQSEDEPELSAYRASDWASTGGLRRIDVGDTAMAEGTFSWREDGGRQVYARNRAMILGGRYHVLLVLGSKSQKAEIDRHFEAVADTYRVTRAP